MPETRIDFDLGGLGKLLAGRRLSVPIYQRSYAWGEDHVGDFASDLKQAFGASPREYFLGTVVFSNSSPEEPTWVIDGQQRLATLAVLFAAMRDFYVSQGEAARGEHIRTLYLSSYDDDEDADVPKLALNADDDLFFTERIILGNEDASPTRPSHELLASAYDQLQRFVAEIAADAGVDWVSRLVEWRKFLDEQARVVHVTVPDESDAFLIFETLNDRGVDLTLADLLKNYLFGRSAEKLDFVRDRWISALATFDQDASLFIVFIRHYWSSLYGPTRERDLFKSIKAEITTKQQTTRFAEDLEAAARLYAALLSGDHEYWNSWGTTTKNNLDTLNRLGLEQNRPMFLAAMQHFTHAEMTRTLRASVSWSVRGLIVGGIGGGSTEKAYANAAVEIRKGNVKSAQELLGELSNIVPSDEEFKSAFETARVTKATLARYYLNAMEREHMGTEEPELVPNSNEEQVNLEHVLPKNPTEDEWSQFTDEQQKDFLHRIGNMALLAKTPNGRIGNKPFAVKKPKFSASDLLLTQEVGAQDDWAPDGIIARQKRLAELAVDTWNRDPE